MDRYRRRRRRNLPERRNPFKAPAPRRRLRRGLERRVRIIRPFNPITPPSKGPNPYDFNKHPRYDKRRFSESYIDDFNDENTAFHFDPGHNLMKEVPYEVPRVFGSRQLGNIDFRDDKDKDDDKGPGYHPAPKNDYGDEPPTAGMAKLKEKPKLDILKG